MAILYITELETLGTPSEGGNCQVAHYPPVAEQTIAIGASSVASAAFNAATRFIRVETDAICAFDIRPAPTAVVSTTTAAVAPGTGRLNVGDREYFGVTPGHKIAVIATT